MLLYIFFGEMSFQSLDNLKIFLKTPILDVLKVIGIFFLRLLAAHPGAPHPDIPMGIGGEGGEGATKRNLSQLGPWPGELCSQEFKP